MNVMILVTGMLDAVYFDLSEMKSVLAIKPKPPFAPVFGVAAARAGSGVELVPKGKPPAEMPGTDPDLCFWWRRGRVDLHRKHSNPSADEHLIVAVLG